jgi:hypothetical protein
MMVKWMGRQRGRWIDKLIDRQTDRITDGQTDVRAGRQAGRRTDRQTVRQGADGQTRQSETQTNGWTDSQTYGRDRQSKCVLLQR